MGSNIRGQNERRNPVTSTLRRMGPGTGFLQTRKEKKIHSTSLPKPWQCWYHLRKNPEEREFVIDSGTSMHMLSKKDQRSRNSVTVVTVNEVVQMNEDAPIYIYIHDLHLFVVVHLLEDILAVLSLDKLCEEHGYTYEWTSGHKPHLTKNGKNIFNITGNYVLSVAPWTRIPARAPPRNRFRKIIPYIQQMRELRELATRKLPETTAREFREPRESRNASSRKQFSGLRFGTSYESGIKIQEIQIFYSLTKRPKLRGLQSNQDYEGSSQKTHRRSGTSSRKVG